MGARNPANQMTVDELIQNGLTVSKKFPVSEEAKNEQGLLLGLVRHRYGNNAAICAARLFASVQHFVPEGVGARGVYALTEGVLERIDFNSDSVMIDGVRIRFSNIYSITIDGFDPFDTDDEEDWETRQARMTPREKRQYERQMEELREQMRLDWERQQLQMRRQMERDMQRQRDQDRQRAWEKQRATRQGQAIPSDGDTEDDDGYVPDYDPDDYPSRNQDGGAQGRQSKARGKREPKTILWLPPGKRSQRKPGARKTGKAAEA